VKLTAKRTQLKRMQYQLLLYVWKAIRHVRNGSLACLQQIPVKLEIL